MSEPMKFLSSRMFVMQILYILLEIIILHQVESHTKS